MLPEPKTWHFGVLPFTGTGHVNPLIALAQELQSRGHRVTFFEKPKIEERVRRAGLQFIALHAAKPLTVEATPPRNTGILSEFATLRFNLERVLRDIEHYLQKTPAAIQRAGVDVLLVNEVALTGPTVAQMLNLPYFLIATSVPHHFGWNGSSWLTGHRNSTSFGSWLQCHILELSALRMRGPIRQEIDAHRRSLGLGRVHEIPKDYPCLAHITQLPQCLDSSHRPEPADVFHTGPWISRTDRPDVEFPWHRLDGRTLIYATLGTTRNIHPPLFTMIAEACQNLDVQLVITLGNRFDPALFADLPGQPVVTRFAPQLDLMKIATVVISHGGPNTTFEALMEARPMVVIPLAYDQPAIAARLARLGIAEALPAKMLSAQRIRVALTTILGDSRYRERAQAVQAALRATPGAARAADIILAKLEKLVARQQDPLSLTQREA